ncbi:MAG: rod shape-determining protein MreC [Gammaproteobacteria bacterium]
MRGPSENSRLVVFVAISLVLMTVDHRQHHLESVRSALSFVISPLEYMLSVPVGAGHWLGEALSSRQTLEQQIAELRSRELLQSARLQKLAALEAENTRLRSLLDSSFKVGERVLVAELLEVDFDPFSQEIVINKGSHDGVEIGQSIVDAEGVMGQVVHVAPFTSTAMLITDPSHAIPVAVNRNGLRAIAMGTGAADRLDIPNLPLNADIQTGDLLVTSGLGGRFPPGYPVAVVKKVVRNPGQPFADVTARPTAHLEQSREVLLVWRSSQQPADAPCDPDHGPCPSADDKAPAKAKSGKGS